MSLVYLLRNVANNVYHRLSKLKKNASHKPTSLVDRVWCCFVYCLSRPFINLTLLPGPRTTSREHQSVHRHLPWFTGNCLSDTISEPRKSSGSMKTITSIPGNYLYIPRIYFSFQEHTFCSNNSFLSKNMNFIPPPTKNNNNQTKIKSFLLQGHAIFSCLSETEI